MSPVQVIAALLVLSNLAFVHVTDAVGLHWLVPMYALTVVAPWTVRWRENVLWRGGWNVAVIAIFAILMRDFSTTGPRHLLEDGLTLAAFCQVHLLNALRSGQRPDLLFFNSFLIALVTSFFCQDLVYSVIFIGYAFVFLVALQLGAATGDTDLDAHATRRIATDGARRAFVALGVTMLVFALWPRDFRRPGLIEDDRWLERLTGTTATGFAEEVRLGRSAHATVDERIVLRIRPLDGSPNDVPSHWRGATMSAFDRYGWRRAPGTAIGILDALRTPWHRQGADRWTRSCNGPRPAARG